MTPSTPHIALVPFEFHVQVVHLEMTDGKPTGKQVGPVEDLYGIAAVRAWLDALEADA